MNENVLLALNEEALKIAKVLLSENIEFSYELKELFNYLVRANLEVITPKKSK